MADEQPNVDRFILDEIESVPHLEALLLLWRCAPQAKTGAEIAEQLYVSPTQGAAITEDLHRRGLIEGHAAQPGAYFYDRQLEERNRLLAAVEETYRRELIRISGIIHSKASPSVRAFANAFRFRKD